MSEFEQDYFRGSPAKKSSLSAGLGARERLPAQQSTARMQDVGVVNGCGQHWRGSLLLVCFVLGALCAIQQGDGGMSGMCVCCSCNTLYSLFADDFLTCPQAADLVKHALSKNF